MFVTINSTPTRINKSHLIDLYEKVSWGAPDKKFAAKLAERLYGEADSPLRYKINRLGGRSRQEKWILQAELYNELYRWVQADWKELGGRVGAGRASAEIDRCYDMVRDFLKAAERVSGRAVPYEIVARRAGDPVSTYADPTKIASVLGWRATKGLDEIVASAWRWHSTHLDGYGA